MSESPHLSAKARYSATLSGRDPAAAAAENSSAPAMTGAPEALEMIETMKGHPLPTGC